MQTLFYIRLFPPTFLLLHGFVFVLHVAPTGGSSLVESFQSSCKMGFLDLLWIASMPVLEMLIITILGSFLALDRVDVLGEIARNFTNKLVFFVFNPALVGVNLAKTITFDSMVLLWFMPFNILITVVVGSALGWILVKLTRPPQHLKGLIIGCCAAGTIIGAKHYFANLGNLPLIIVPAVCKEKGSPFGDPDACHTYGMAYTSLAMAIGAVFLWSYVYNIMRVSSTKAIDVASKDESIDVHHNDEVTQPFHSDIIDELHPSKEYPVLVDKRYGSNPPSMPYENRAKVNLLNVVQCIRRLLSKMNLKTLFTPSTTGAFVGFMVGVIPQLRGFLIGGKAPFHVIEDSTSFLGDAAIPTMTLIMGGNLLRGLKGSGVNLSIIIGIIAVRYVVLPLLGICIVKGAIHIGLVNSDPLYQFVLLLQYALPPAINIGTITQQFGAGESECSVIMLWTYSFASVVMTLWSTLFMSLIS